MAETKQRRGSVFPTTHWSRIAAATGGDAAGLEELGRLLETYQPAIRTYLERKFGLNEDEARDACQGFICQQVLRRGLLARARPDKGRFRNLLCRALRNHWINELKARQAQCRAPANGLESLEAQGEAEVLGCDGPPESEFDRVWAVQVVERACERMRAACQAEGRTDLWEVFEARELGPVFHGRPELGYGELVRRFGYRSPAQAYNARTTCLRKFRRSLQAVVAEYESRDATVREEVEAVLDILVRAAAWKGELRLKPPLREALAVLEAAG